MATRFRSTSPSTLRDAWRMRRVWWFTATSRTRARFSRTLFGSFWLGLSNLFSIAALAAVYGTVFKVQDFNVYVVYLGLGLVVWNSLGAAISSAPNLFEHNSVHVHNTNLNPVFYTLEEWAFQLQTFAQSFGLVLLVLSWFQPTLLLHLLQFGWIPLLNFALFIYWFPVMLCLLGARFRDLYQLVPILLQLVFLLSPILYKKADLGAMAWTASVNPIYQVMATIRDTLMVGEVSVAKSVILLTMNGLGMLMAIKLLDRERPNLPFLI